MCSFLGGDYLKIKAILERIKNYPLVVDHEIQKYAILIPLLEIKGEIHLLFEVRAHHLHHQPGDVCFPGGRVEKEDSNEKESAIRETMEELCTPRNNISNVYPLTFFSPSPKRKIYTFVGQLIDPNKIFLDPNEVDEIFTVPLEYFLETEPEVFKVTLQAKPEKNFPYHLIVGGEAYDWGDETIDQYFYQYKDRVIWGLTAKILRQFINVLHKESADRTNDHSR